MVHWSAGEGSQLSKMRAPPQACQNENVKKAEMALKTKKKTSRWKMRSIGQRVEENNRGRIR